MMLRRPISRTITLWPLVVVMLATADSGISAPAAVRKRNAPMARGSLRYRCGKTHGEVVALLADIHLPDRAAADAGGNQIRHIGGIDAVARCRIPVEAHLQVGQGRLHVHGDIRSAWHCVQGCSHLFGNATDLLQVVAEHLDGQVAVCTGELVLHAVDHRLHHADRIAGHLCITRAKRSDQSLLVHARWPVFVRTQANARFDMRGRPVVGAIVVAPGLGHHVRHLGKFQRGRAQGVGHACCLVQGDAWRHLHL